MTAWDMWRWTAARDRKESFAQMDIIKPFLTTALLFALIMFMLFLDKYFRAVSEKNKRPLSQESFKIEISKGFKE